MNTQCSTFLAVALIWHESSSLLRAIKPHCSLNKSLHSICMAMPHSEFTCYPNCIDKDHSSGYKCFTELPLRRLSLDRNTQKRTLTQYEIKHIKWSQAESLLHAEEPLETNTKRKVLCGLAADSWQCTQCANTAGLQTWQSRNLRPYWTLSSSL